MNTESSATPESLELQKVAAAAGPMPRPFYWSVRRELWEYRSIYLAPLAIVGVFLLGFLISLVHLAAKVRAVPALDAAQRYNAVAAPYYIAAYLMMLTTILVSVFYCLDALHSERRDRSILFWKSLPVSDLTTVLAKASIAIIIVPVVTSVIGAVLQLVMLLLSSAVLLGSGLSVAPLWARLPWPWLSLLLLYHMLTAHGLWPAPVYGWLLLVSGWARRATFLWATVPLLAIAGIEAMAFHSFHFIDLLGRRLIGDTAGHMPGGIVFGFTSELMMHTTPAALLSSPGLWIGLAITAAFLAAAVRLRRYREPV